MQAAVKPNSKLAAAAAEKIYKGEGKGVFTIHYALLPTT
jgi:hypothetical protein